MIKKIIAVIGLILLLSEASHRESMDHSATYLNSLFKPAIEKIIKIVN